MRAFLCRSHVDSHFFIGVKSLLEPHFEQVFAFELAQVASTDWATTLVRAPNKSEVMLVFVALFEPASRPQLTSPSLPWFTAAWTPATEWRP
ncbi:MAG: hypothetical protein JXA87_06985 [Thermoleophilia bacterium]|nr:hypothetical protein [Thermoleophilia bacterium]